MNNASAIASVDHFKCLLEGDEQRCRYGYYGNVELGMRVAELINTYLTETFWTLASFS
jgi:hypothetical protein